MMPIFKSLASIGIGSATLCFCNIVTPMAGHFNAYTLVDIQYIRPLERPSNAPIMIMYARIRATVSL